MKRKLCRLMAITLLCGVAGIGLTGGTNRGGELSGQFDPNIGWVGDWERAWDIDGPLEADAYRAAYTNNNKNTDVVKATSQVYSYAVNLPFTGTYHVSASVWIEGFGTNAHSGTFQGTAYDFETQKASVPNGAGPIPGFPHISFASSWGWISGVLPPVPPGPGAGNGSGSGGNGGNGGDPPVHHSAYAHVPF